MERRGRHIQDEIENRVLTLVVSGGKFTGRTFLKAVSAYLRSHDQKKQVKKQLKVTKKQDKAQRQSEDGGKKTLKELMRQGKTLDSIDVDSFETRAFEKIARRYNVNYAVKMDKGTGKYYIFFKSKDTGTLNTVFREYAAAMQQRKDKVAKAKEDKAVRVQENKEVKAARAQLKEQMQEVKAWQKKTRKETRKAMAQKRATKIKAEKQTYMSRFAYIKNRLSLGAVSKSEDVLKALAQMIRSRRKSHRGRKNRPLDAQSPASRSAPGQNSTALAVYKPAPLAVRGPAPESLAQKLAYARFALAQMGRGRSGGPRARQNQPPTR